MPWNHTQVLQQHLAARSTTNRLEEGDRRTSTEAKQVDLRNRILSSDSTDVSVVQADGATHHQQITIVDGRQQPVQVPFRIQKKTKLSEPHPAPCRSTKPSTTSSSRCPSTLQDGAARSPRQCAEFRRGLPEEPLNPSSCRRSHVKHVLPQKWNAQGSVLSPLLFMILINDLPESSNGVKLALFADDSSMWKFGPNLPALTRDVQYLTDSSKNRVSRSRSTRWSLSSSHEASTYRQMSF